MITNYNAISLITGSVIKLSYKGEHLFRIELKKGSLQKFSLEKALPTIPIKLSEIQLYINRWDGKVSYEKIVKDQTLHQKFSSVWFEFYFNQTGNYPKFTGVDGNHLKQIIKYLKQESGTEQEALDLWQTMLNNWGKLEKFYRENIDLKIINSKFNLILNNVKREINDNTNPFRS
ncbi:hypothetical protein EZY14_016390 [Kordia sp. TARA_039_SRF]|nr:hypothetical protein EZY14_016390 [Kordia sp. TARA_039_SRF]